MKKKSFPKRKYHDGDIVEFDFRPDSLDVNDWHDVTLAGIISGVIYEKDSVSYKVQLRDNSRKIFGDIVVPEGQINRIINGDII